MAITQAVPPIARGYGYALRVHVTGGDAPFPLGCELKAEIRDKAGAQALSGTLTTVDGSIERVDEATVDLRLSSTITAALGRRETVLDIIRTDVSPDQWLGIQLKLPVVDPVTKPGPDA